MIEPKKESVIPGMIASPVSVESGESIGDNIEWGAGQDSFYEVVFTEMRLTGSTLSKRSFCGRMKRQSCIEIDGSLPLRILLRILQAGVYQPSIIQHIDTSQYMTDGKRI